MNWLQAWPTEALLSTATSMLSDPALSLSPPLTAAVAELCVIVHQDATALAHKYLLEMKRRTYVTPSSFTELIVVYKRLLSEKMRAVLDDCNRLNSGVSKLDSTAESVAKMKAEVRCCSWVDETSMCCVVYTVCLCIHLHAVGLMRPVYTVCLCIHLHYDERGACCAFLQLELLQPTLRQNTTETEQVMAEVDKETHEVESIRTVMARVSELSTRRWPPRNGGCVVW